MYQRANDFSGATDRRLGGLFFAREWRTQRISENPSPAPVRTLEGERYPQLSELIVDSTIGSRACSPKQKGKDLVTCVFRRLWEWFTSWVLISFLPG